MLNYDEGMVGGVGFLMSVVIDKAAMLPAGVGGTVSVKPLLINLDPGSPTVHEPRVTEALISLICTQKSCPFQHTERPFYLLSTTSGPPGRAPKGHAIIEWT